MTQVRCLTNISTMSGTHRDGDVVDLPEDIVKRLEPAGAVERIVVMRSTPAPVVFEEAAAPEPEPPVMTPDPEVVTFDEPEQPTPPARPSNVHRRR